MLTSAATGHLLDEEEAADKSEQGERIAHGAEDRLARTEVREEHAHDRGKEYECAEDGAHEPHDIADRAERRSGR